MKKGVKKVRFGEDFSDTIKEHISKVDKTMTKEEEDLIMNSLRNHYVFYALTDDELSYVV